MKENIKLVVQPRLSKRKYLYEYYAEIIDESKGKKDLWKGGGVSLNKEVAKIKAIAEAIERYSGNYINKRLFTRSFKEVKEKALNPRNIICFSKNQYRKNFPYNKFRSLIPINWVKGYSLTKKKTILVPAFAVYLGYNRLIPEEPIFIPTTSNGLAADKSIGKATLRGIFEVIERDALMITWYSKKRIPRLDLRSIQLPELRYLYEKITKENLSIAIGITTLDIPIPSVVSIIYDNKKRIPYASFGSAASYDIERATLKALEEALLVREVLEILYEQKKLKITTPKAVNTFLDHAILYALPKYRKAWSFLLKGPVYPLGEIKRLYNFPTENLLNLKNILKILEGKRKEVVLVNLTNNIIKNTGFKVVRIIIPGLQPIDVTYNARFLGGRRLHKFIKNPRNINSYPHPLG
jgi:ribosomal protein S12 methylthiotransferase accessory factor